ncbi:MAG: methyltransferase domain-containing protein [Magnetococcales bacterium]|nr:methyltransferase domain-containing protein [Magnetococcales bacterium]
MSTAESYDAIPYDSFAVAETHPDHLAVMGRLHGVSTASPHQASVLELGCGNGANLIAMAFHLPGSRFVGIDLSSVQIAEGRAWIQAAGLENCELRCADLTDIAGDAGSFDYIVAHGLYSWVPEPVRQAILRLCARCLKPGGVVSISYNTLPGWRFKGVLRDYLRVECADIADPKRRVQVARKALSQLAAQLGNSVGPVARLMRQEAEGLLGRPDCYLFHEYLEAFNEPLLFETFVGQARSAGLAYMCDGDFGVSVPDAREMAWLDEIGDRVARGQREDFLTLRSFRQTLLCRADEARRDEPMLERLEELSFFARLEPVAPVDLLRGREQAFQRPGGERIGVVQPSVRAALVKLAEVFPDGLGFHALREEAFRRLGTLSGGDVLRMEAHFFGELAALVLRGGVGVTLREVVVPEKPLQASALVLSRLRQGVTHVATPRHQDLPLDAFQRALLPLLDGSRSRESLLSDMVAWVREDVSRLDGRAGSWPEARLMKAVGEKLRIGLNVLLRHGLIRE